MFLSICVVISLGQRLVSWYIIETQDADMSFWCCLPLLNTNLTESVINVCEMFGKFVKFTAEMFSECQNVDIVKRPAKITDVCMFYTFICPEYM